MQNIAFQIEFQGIHFRNFSFVHFLQTELVHCSRGVSSGVESFGFEGVFVDTGTHRFDFGVQEREGGLQFGNRFGHIGFVVFGRCEQGWEMGNTLEQPPRGIGDQGGHCVEGDVNGVNERKGEEKEAEERVAVLT